MAKKKGKKKSAEKALVKQAARDLGVDYHKGMGLGDLIKSQADQIVKQSASSVSRDADEFATAGRLSLYSRRDLAPVDQDRLIQMANYLASGNLLGSRIKKIYRDFVIGDGVKFNAEDKTVIQPLLDEFWNDPVNKFKSFQFDLTEYLGTMGELLLPTFVNDYSGKVRVGWIDPIEVMYVIPDQHNRRIMREVRMKPGAGAGFATFYDFSVEKRYQIINVDTDETSPTYNYRTGNIFHFKINCAPDATRGRSDYEPIADILDAWDQAVFNDLERVQQLLNYIWDVTLTGKSEPDIQTWLDKQSSPSPGSMRAHNENVKWEAVAPDIKLTETGKFSKQVRNDALGGAGLSPFFFGDTENSNRASSENLELPILRGFSARQRTMSWVFEEMGDFVIDQAALARPTVRRWLENRKHSRKFTVDMPELSTRDISRVGAALSQIAMALDQAVQRGWLSQGMAAVIFAAQIGQLGTQYDAAEEMARAAEEKQANAQDDYKDTKTLDGMRSDPRLLNPAASEAVQ
jgi:hypothetical protein